MTNINLGWLSVPGVAESWAVRSHLVVFYFNSAYSQVVCPSPWDLRELHHPWGTHRFSVRPCRAENLVTQRHDLMVHVMLLNGVTSLSAFTNKELACFFKIRISRVFWKTWISGCTETTLTGNLSWELSGSFSFNWATHSRPFHTQSLLSTPGPCRLLSLWPLICR